MVELVIITVNQQGDFHKGIDIKAPTGRPIVSLADGKVLIAEDFRLHGKTVSVDHGQRINEYLYTYVRHKR